MSVSAAMVKELREKTGVGMMACKKVLTESEGDIEQAIKLLRERGLSAANKKAEREVNEGRIFTVLSDDKKQAVIKELNCETDFVAGNDEFIAMGSQVASAILATGTSSLDGLPAMDIDGQRFDAFLPEKILKLGENIGVKQFELIKSAGQIYNYTHMNGKIGVLVEFSADVDAELGQDVAMHVAAANPLYLKSEDVPSTDLDSEREILKKQVLAEGKPANIVDKIVDGKLGKFFKEVCLLEQPFVKDPSNSIKKLLPEGVEIVRFVRYAQA